ncbi:hypothetical protein M422DRAFT_785099 [Sphaerobolus stellatus SS14]|uniref:Uncharacterized protein n=1 Tax=Sphaerobolus stellatus (strain SS14) TaxID=990650 RepID=A0A0C9UNT4_SPHS4|nr:hypothetical protein M422DRAFT_785099 [Sphaerobolus stellatus SS14]
MSVLLSPRALPQSAAAHPGQPVSDRHEFTDLQTASSSFVSRVIASYGRRPLRLLCTVPTWCTSELYPSLDDLHDLRTRSLVFVHDLCNKLQAAGIQVSYRLALCDTPLVLLRALPEDSACTRDDHDALELAKHGGREKALVTSLQGVPSIILT